MILRKRLGWVPSASAAITRALIDVKLPAQITTTVDPIKVIVTMHLASPMHKDSRAPLRTFLRLYAKEWDCEVPRILIENKFIKAEVLTKRRHWHGGKHETDSGPGRGGAGGSGRADGNGGGGVRDEGPAG
jgi:hypothetical protein